MLPSLIEMANQRRGLSTLSDLILQLPIASQ